MTKNRLAKYRTGIPDKEIIKIENTDKKDWKENWTAGRSLCDFPHSFRCCIVGLVNMGKSTIAKNILIQCQLGEKPFRQLIVVHGSKYSSEYDELDPNFILDDIPTVDELLSGGEEEESQKTLLIIDDFEMTKLSKEQLQRLSQLFRFVSSHHNISIIICYQSFFEVPTIVLKCCNIFITFKPNNLDEIVVLGKRIGLSKKQMTYIFQNHIKEKRDTLTVDLTENSPAKYRINLYNVLNAEQIENIR